MSKFSGGDGTAGNPFLISTPQDLIDINTTDEAFHFLQVNDLDFSSVGPISPITSSDGWTFSGVYDGGLNTISNITIDVGDNEGGLFKILTGATIKDLIVNNIKVYGNNEIGSIASYSQGSTFTSIEVAGADLFSRSGSLIGGFVKTLTSNSVVDKCSVTGNANSSLSNGFSYRVDDSSVTNCYADLAIISNGTFIANASNFINNYGNSIVRMCYSVSNISNSNAGGLTSTGIIPMYKLGCTSCYENVEHGITDIPWKQSDYRRYRAGELVRGNSDMLYECIKEVSVNEYPHPPGTASGWQEYWKLIAPNTMPTTRGTAQMKTKSNYVGWDFDKVWTIKEGEDYPRLRMVKICKSMGMPL